MRRLLPDPGPTTVTEQLETYRPWEQEREGRPFVAVNFAATVDGRATIGGVSGPIGSDTDTAMLAGLRKRFDVVMIGAGTMRAERYAGLDKRLVVVETQGGRTGRPHGRALHREWGAVITASRETDEVRSRRWTARVGLREEACGR